MRSLSPEVLSREIILKKRPGNNPKRRIIRRDKIDRNLLSKIVENACYVGNARHKSKPADYGFTPPVNPRPKKSLCDANRIVRNEQAQALFFEGLRRGMISSHFVHNIPKYIWSIDESGKVYEAEISGNSSEYDGYELNDSDSQMRNIVKAEWNSRCPII